MFAVHYGVQILKSTSTHILIFFRWLKKELYLIEDDLKIFEYKNVTLNDFAAFAPA